MVLTISTVESSGGVSRETSGEARPHRGPCGDCGRVTLRSNAARHRKTKIHRRGVEERRRYAEVRAQVVTPQRSSFHPFGPRAEPETVTILPLPLGSPPRLIGEP
jgi:hypothetical protein